MVRCGSCKRWISRLMGEKLPDSLWWRRFRPCLDAAVGCLWPERFPFSKLDFNSVRAMALLTGVPCGEPCCRSICHKNPGPGLCSDTATPAPSRAAVGQLQAGQWESEAGPVAIHWHGGWDKTSWASGGLREWQAGLQGPLQARHRDPHCPRPRAGQGVPGRRVR